MFNKENNESLKNEFYKYIEDDYSNWSFLHKSYNTHYYKEYTSPKYENFKFIYSDKLHKITIHVKGYGTVCTYLTIIEAFKLKKILKKIRNKDDIDFDREIKPLLTNNKEKNKCKIEN